MKKLLMIILLLLFSMLAPAQCRIAEIISQNKTGFQAPYKYDGFNYFKIGFTEQEQKIKKEFIAFKGQTYQLIFCTSGFEETVRISISESTNNSLVAGTTVGSDVTTWSFICTKTGSYTIEYDIPASETGVAHEGCIAMLIGFAEK
jgi:hypothetical protein